MGMETVVGVYLFRRKNLEDLIQSESDGVKKAFAERTGLAPAHVSQMVNGTREVGEKVARRIEQAIGLPAGYMDVDHESETVIQENIQFDTDAGPRVLFSRKPKVPERHGIRERIGSIFRRTTDEDEHHGISEPEPDNVKACYDMSFDQFGNSDAMVPVLDWDEASRWHRSGNQPGEQRATRFILCPVPHGPNTYALQVSGDAMLSGHGASYPEGSTIFVDPDQAKFVRPSDKVIAQIDGVEDLAFKLYTKDGGRTMLRSLNSHYPPITNDFVVLGKIIGAWIE